MSMLLFIIGGIAVMVGAATVAFGIPINEFSFGNTLIVSGSTVGTGGLVIIAIAAAVSRLNRIAEAMTQRTEAFPHEALGAPPEAHGVEAPGRMPFPPRTRPVTPAEPPGFEPLAPESVGEEAAAPALRNPEAPPIPEEALPPPHSEVPPIPPPPSFAPPERPAMPPPLPPPSEPGFMPPWRKRERAKDTNFDAMWPEPSKPAPSAHAEPEPEPEPAAPPPPPLPPAERPRTVAVLKSGVVDGMGYTLYVDGSIEAELPQGTMRFASIDELRAHLEKGP